LEQVDGKFLMTEVVLIPRVTISDEAESTRAVRILEKSETARLISNSVKSKIIMNPVVEVVASATKA
jgi:hypothetical protein